MHKPTKPSEPRSTSVYLDGQDIHREYEAMMSRPLPAWLDRALFVAGGIVLTVVAMAVFLPR